MLPLLDLENVMLICMREYVMLLDQENIIVWDHVNIMLLDEVKGSILLFGCMNLKMMYESGTVILSYG